MCGSEPPSRWLGEVGRLLTEHLAADGCIVYLVDPAASQLVAAAVVPEPRTGVPDLQLPLGFGVTGRVAVDGVAAVFVDDHPRNPVHRALLGLAPGQAVSRLCAPALSPRGQAHAIIAVHSRSSRSFSHDEVAIALAVGRLVGLRLDRDLATAVADGHRSAWEGLVAATVSPQEAERRRVAAELHDGVAQAIASLAFHLSAAQVALAEQGPTFAAAQVQAARELADLAFLETRTAVSGLRSPVLDDLGLAAGLESLARSIPQLAVAVDADELDLPEHVSTALFRIAQEAIQDAGKHAQATNVRVVLSRTGTRVRLTVSDDGRGFVPSTGTDEPGYGLVGMHERVQLLGGRLAVESEPGQGTTVRAVVPLPG